jgi:hypothetical protein
MQRYDVINALLKRCSPKNQSYLEIGLESANQCFNKIHCFSKISVDPNPKADASFQMTSDEFFEKLDKGKFWLPYDYKWGVVFIDGLHLAYQVERDIKNALRHCSGYVVLHDCNPKDFWNAHDNEAYYLRTPHEWNGTVWKAFYKFRCENETRAFTVDTDYGCGIIDVNGRGEKIAHTNKFYEFEHFSKNREEQIGLISVEEFSNEYS